MNDSKSIKKTAAGTEQRISGQQLSKNNCGCSCCCHNDHDHKGADNDVRHQRTITILRLAIGAGLLIAALLLHADWLKLALYIVSLLVCGGPVFLQAGRNIIHGRIFDENLLMTIAAMGAFAIGEYPEGSAVMLFYQVGELFEDRAVDNSRRAIAALTDIRPDHAELLQADGQTTLQVDPEEVQVGQLIMVRPGQRVPLDCLVRQGSSLLDSSALTGESLPQPVEEGQELLSGCINLTSPLIAEVSKPYKESTASRILELVENAVGRKSHAEAFISKFARVYTPVVVGLAVLLAVLPPLLLQQPFSSWLHRALVFLVVSCPCALVISVPLSFYAGLGAASRHGILIKGSNYLEALSHLDTLVYDKTGTLTIGKPQVKDVLPAEGYSREEILLLAAAVESCSDHPLAKALQRAAAGQKLPQVQGIRELAGRGLRAQLAEKQIIVGNSRLMAENGVDFPEIEAAGAISYLAINNTYAGCIIFSDQTKEGAAQAIAALRSLGIRKQIMLSGDNPGAAAAVAEELGLDSYYASLLPGDKVTKLEEILAEPGGGKLAFVGDGINDAPVLARADIGIAMGALGSDAAIEAADIVLMEDRLGSLPQAVLLSRRTMKLVRENIIFSLGVKLAVLILSVCGIANLWLAVIADVGVAILAILNALRQK